MIPPKSWFSAAELAELALPGMPRTTRGVQLQAERDGWLVPNGEGVSWRQRKGRGGGKEFHFSRLPPLALRAFLDRLDTGSREC